MHFGMHHRNLFDLSGKVNTVYYGIHHRRSHGKALFYFRIRNQRVEHILCAPYFTLIYEETVCPKHVALVSR